MPFQGRFYTSEELQRLLRVTKQRISNLAHTYGWESPSPGLYRGGVAEDTATVDAYLFARWRAEILGSKKPLWDDSYDLECPECGAFAVEVGDGWKCKKGHNSGPV